MSEKTLQSEMREEKTEPLQSSIDKPTQKETTRVPTKKEDSSSLKSDKPATGYKASTAKARDMEAELKKQMEKDEFTLDWLRRKKAYLQGMSDFVDPNMPDFVAPDGKTDNIAQQALNENAMLRPQAPELQDISPSKNQIFINMAISALGALGGAGGQKYGMQAGVEVGAAGMDQMTKNMQFREKQNQVLSQTYTKSMDAWRKDRSAIYMDYMKETSKTDREMMSLASSRWEHEYKLKQEKSLKIIDDLLDNQKITKDYHTQLVNNARNINTVRTENMKEMNKAQKFSVQQAQVAFNRDQARLARKLPSWKKTDMSAVTAYFPNQASGITHIFDTIANKFSQKELNDAEHVAYNFNAPLDGLVAKYKNVTDATRPDAIDTAKRMLAFADVLARGDGIPSNLDEATLLTLDWNEQGGFTDFTTSHADEFGIYDAVKPIDKAKKALILAKMVRTANRILLGVNSLDAEKSRVVQAEIKRSENQKKKIGETAVKKAFEQEKQILKLQESYSKAIESEKESIVQNLNNIDTKNTWSDDDGVLKKTKGKKED